MKLDINKVEKIINDKNVSYDRITAETGMSKGAIYPYRSGEREIEKMQIENALKLEKLYKKIKEEPEMDIKIKGIKKAVGEFNNDPNAVRIYLDKKKLEVWANVYASLSEWDEYHDENIIEVASRENFEDRTITMRELTELCIVHTQ